MSTPSPLPDQATLAMIAALLPPTESPYRRMLAALELWHQAGKALALEPARQKAAKKRKERDDARSIQLNAEEARKAAEYDADPFGLTKVICDGRIKASDFISVVLPDSPKENPDAEAEAQGDGAALPPWTPRLRTWILKRFLLGKDPVYGKAEARDLSKWENLDPDNATAEDFAALGLQDPIEWRPKFKNRAKLLNDFTSKGLPAKRVIEFARAFEAFAAKRTPEFRGR